MANFTRAKPAGWADWPAPGGQLEAVQINAIDIDHAKAINGDDGSSHAPAAVIQIDGAGLQVGGAGLLSTTAIQLQGPTTFGWQVAQTLQRRLNLGAAFPMVATYWSRLLVGNAIAWQQDDIFAAQALFIPIPPMANSCTITQIQVTVDGDAGAGGPHPGAWPPTLPSIGLYDAAAGVVAGTTATDGTGSWVAYEAAHIITAGPFAAVTQQPSNEFYVVVYGETGGTAQASSLAVTKVQVFGSIQDLKPLS